ncbi:hypothetical protein [Candidatus Synechococcus spongiarum]|uniref:hypothetical protein n=1 Tax=Candidatus Synechococcus spongiarum TaxID=431041 RepID=UPI001267B3B4
MRQTAARCWLPHPAPPWWRVQQGVHAAVGAGAQGMAQREGRPAIGWVGLPGEGDRHALLPELLIDMGEQGAAPQLPPDAALRVVPDNAGAQVGPEAGFRITAILPDAHLQCRSEESASGQGEGPCGCQPQAAPGDAVVGGLKALHLLGGGDADARSAAIDE